MLSTYLVPIIMYQVLTGYLPVHTRYFYLILAWFILNSHLICAWYLLVTYLIFTVAYLVCTWNLHGTSWVSTRHIPGCSLYFLQCFYSCSCLLCLLQNIVLTFLINFLIVTGTVKYKNNKKCFIDSYRFIVQIYMWLEHKQ